MTDRHYFANDGSDWTSKRSPVDSREARAADREIDEEAARGDGFSATNEPRLERTIVEQGPPPENDDTAEGEEANGA